MSVSIEYRAEFYDVMTEAAAHAAARVVPVILQAVRPASVVDVGCGAGAWARAFMDQGVDDVTGVDGEWVEPRSLQIPKEYLIRRSLLEPVTLPRRFDVCLCLETAEHLPVSRAHAFVSELTALSDIVVFSAAVPYQGGTHHLNERWQTYWSDLFASNNYVGVDYLRRRIWGLHRHNTWFYAQNMIIYVRQEKLPGYPTLEAEYRYQGGPPIALVHPGLLALHTPWQKHLTVRQYLRLFPSMIGRAWKALWRGVRGVRNPGIPCHLLPGANEWPKFEGE